MQPVAVAAPAVQRVAAAVQAVPQEGVEAPDARLAAEAALDEPAAEDAPDAALVAPGAESAAALAAQA